MSQPLMPLQADTCPVCGQPNACAVSACGRFDADCWCAQVAISPQALARVPVALKNKACLCQRCAQGPTTAAASTQNPTPTPTA